MTPSRQQAVTNRGFDARNIGDATKGKRNPAFGNNDDEIPDARIIEL